MTAQNILADQKEFFLSNQTKSIKFRIKQLKKLKVTATAYTSDPNETDSTPNIAAWGDQLKIGMNVIAVSRDLLTKSKLKGSLVFPVGRIYN